MIRRRFLVGLASALVAAHVPVKGIQFLTGPEPLRESVLAMLTKVYNDYCRGKGLGNLPRFIAVGGSLYRAFEGELLVNQRFVNSALAKEGYRTLRFKGLAMYVNTNLNGWEYQFEKERHA